MKILHISPSYFPAISIGGPVTATHELNQHLISQGQDVTVYTTNTTIENQFPHITNNIIDGVPVWFFPYMGILEWCGESGWQYSPVLKSVFEKTIDNFDVIHITGIWNYPSTMAIKLCHRFHKPCLISPHGSLKPYHMKNHNWKKMIYYELMIKRHLGANSYMHYFTQHEAEESMAAVNLKCKPVVIANGINIEKDRYINTNRFLSRLPKLNGSIKLIHLGRIHPVKGLELLINALAELIRQDHAIHLILAGGGDITYVTQLKTIVKRLGMVKHVTFTGMLSYEEKWEALAASDVFVLPSKSEAFSMAILEALSMRLPVVISNTCYFNEVEKEGAGYVVRLTKEDLIKALSTLIKNKQLRKKMGRNGEHLVKTEYNWDNIATLYSETYKRISNESKSINIMRCNQLAI